MAKYGVVPTLILVKLPFIAIVWFGQAWIHPYVIIGLCVLYGLVIFNNVKVLLKG